MKASLLLLFIVAFLCISSNYCKPSWEHGSKNRSDLHAVSESFYLDNIADELDNIPPIVRQNIRNPTKTFGTI